ncbi:hypothetical protein [Streptomyces sp. NPDC057429]|uniref:hypothetical protein n=1 Tax=Streptomyces sp. NPDC057429 TaxID=3346130 RepID=UPI0036A09118
MRSPARLVTGTAAAALTAAALGLATAPSAYAQGAAARQESSAWQVPRANPGTDSEEAGSGAGTDAKTEPGADKDPGTGAELTETELTDTELMETGLMETELMETELTETELTDTELTETGARPGTSPRPEPVKPPPGTKPTPVQPSAPPARAWPERPSGHVRTGVGGSAGPDTAQLVAGAAVLGAAAVGGARLVRRRHADGAQAG